MAASPRYKIFDKAGVYQASCKEVEAAAALVSFYGEGATIRIDHSPKFTIWTEGREEKSAGESYDFVAEVAFSREAGFSSNRPGAV